MTVRDQWCSVGTLRTLWKVLANDTPEPNRLSPRWLTRAGRLTRRPPDDGCRSSAGPGADDEVGQSLSARYVRQDPHIARMATKVGAMFENRKEACMRTARRNRAPFLVFAFALALVVALLGGVTPASATGSTLTLNQASYVQGQTITASYSTASVSSTNWIGLYYSDSTPGQVSSLQWKYAPNSSGQVTFSTSALSPGSYRAYYLYNNGYTSLTDSVFFTILGTAVTTTPGTKSCAAPTAANLLQDGDSECATASASGYDDITVPGWTQTGVPSVVGYTVGNGFPGPSTPGPADRGNQFLSGGPVGDSTLTQSVDLSSAAVLIDTGVVTFSLSGWLGGYSSEASSTTVTAAFLNAQGATLGSGQIGPVTHTDRGNATKLLQRTATAAVPAGTRSAQIVVHLNGDPARNANNQYNDAYADSLSFSVSVPVTVPSAPVPPAASVPGFDHVFFVMLENKSYDQVIGSSAAPY